MLGRRLVPFTAPVLAAAMAAASAGDLSAQERPGAEKRIAAQRGILHDRADRSAAVGGRVPRM